MDHGEEPGGPSWGPGEGGQDVQGLGTDTNGHSCICIFTKINICLDYYEYHYHTNFQFLPTLFFGFFPKRGWQDTQKQKKAVSN